LAWLSCRSSNLTLHAKTPAETCLENRFSPSQLGQEILKLGSRILATLRDFSLFADRTATPQRRRSKRAARCFSNMALWEDYHLRANVLCNLHMQVFPQPCHHMALHADTRTAPSSPLCWIRKLEAIMEESRFYRGTRLQPSQPSWGCGKSLQR